VSDVRAFPSNEIVLDRPAPQGWWLVVDEDFGPGRVLAGPFADRAEAEWAGGGQHGWDARPVHGVGRADGGLDRKPSPQEWAWLAHLGRQLERLPEGWDDGLDEEDPLVTLVVEVASVLCEAGLDLHDADGRGGELGGACLTPAPALDGVVLSWRQHDRMSVEQVHGPAMDTVVQQVMNRALADVLTLRGFGVQPLGDGAGHLVRWEV
jgi:hypothetical protein